MDGVLVWGGGGWLALSTTSSTLGPAAGFPGAHFLNQCDSTDRDVDHIQNPFETQSCLN